MAGKYHWELGAKWDGDHETAEEYRAQVRWPLPSPSRHGGAA
jgi:hypothetical protein